MVEDNLMEVIHRYGILFIQFMQLRCKSWSQLMIWVSNLSNPAWSYVVYFPLVYYLHRSVGRRVLWVAALSEWINAVLKWILHGERPYWWAHEAGMCEGRIKPCNQFYITCETGPGSPSGHCMVTVSVFYVMVSALLYHIFSQSRHRRAAALSLWSLFAVVTCLVNLSRCFIFAHFPHQVITGSIIALLMAMYFNLLSTTSMGLRHYVGVAGGMLVGASGVYLSLSYLGFDPHWSVSKAQRWCAHHSWVYLQTTLFFAVVKASSSLLGLGFAEYMNSLQQRAQDTNKEPGCSVGTFSMISWLSSFAMALMFAFGIEKIKISQGPVVIFYVISYLKYVLVIFVISAIIPRIVEFSVSLLHSKCKKE